MSRTKIPQYPSSEPLNGQTMSSVGGGGGMVQNWSTADPPEAVVAFFEQRLGVANEWGTGSGFAAKWRFDSADEEEKGGERLEIWPAVGSYPFRDDPTAAPPAGTRSIIHQSSFYAPARKQVSSGVGGSARPKRPRAVIPLLLALALIAAVAVLVLFALTARP